MDALEVTKDFKITGHEGFPQPEKTANEAGTGL
jgi:hypothetical protein